MNLSPKLVLFYKGVLGLFCLTLAVPLSAYAYNGLSMRYSGDDYCYAGILRLHGFFETQWYSYMNVSTYNGDRYSLTLFSSLTDIFSPVANGALPVLAILFFLAGMYWVLSSISRLIPREPDARPDRLILFLSSEAIVFFTLYLAPSLGQSLYWRTGMLTYLAPLIANTFLIGFVLSQAQKEGPLGWSLLACLILSILSGGFSETGVALQSTYLGLVLIVLVLLNRQKIGAWPRRAVWLTATSLAGTLIALLLLWISPTNHTRMTQLLPPPPNLTETISLALRGMIIFAYSSIKISNYPERPAQRNFLLLGPVQHPGSPPG